MPKHDHYLTNINYNLAWCFVSVYEIGNVTRAAERLLMSQPKLHGKIKEFEKQMQSPLFIKHPRGRGVVPTKVADMIYPQVKKALILLNNAEDIAIDFHESSSAYIRFGCQSHLATFVILEYLDKFKQAYPNVQFEIISKPKEDLTNMLINREIDFLIDNGTIVADDIITEKQKVDDNSKFESMVLKLLNNRLFASKDFVNKHGLNTTLTEYDIQKYPPFLQGRAYRTVRKFLNRFNIDPNKITYTSTTETMYHFVLKNWGIGFCMEDFLQDNYRINDIIIFETDFELPKNALTLCYYTDAMDKPTKKFLDGLKNHFLNSNKAVKIISDGLQKSKQLDEKII